MSKSKVVVDNGSVIPLGDRVLIRRDVASSVTSAGLHVPEIAVQPVMAGMVLAVGADVGPEIIPGDRVYFSPHASRTTRVYRVDGRFEEVLMLRLAEIEAREPR